MALALQQTFRLQDIAERINAKLHGNGDAVARGICSLDDPAHGCIAFATGLKLLKSAHELRSASVSAVIVEDSLEPRLAEIQGTLNLLFTRDPLASMVQLIPLFYRAHEFTPGISTLADIHPSASIGKGVHIGAFCSIGADVSIGDNCTLHPHVVLYPNVRIGAHCTLHSGVVIREDCDIGPHAIIHNGAILGADGFGYTVDSVGQSVRLQKVPQVGNVQIGEQVEIGANTCIDRATLGSTNIGAGTKIDNLVQIGHNVKVGEHSILCGNVGIGGSSRVGNHVVLGAGTGVADHVDIPDRCRIGAASEVRFSLEKPGDYAGSPEVYPIPEWRKQAVALRHLPQLVKQLRVLLKGKE